MSKSSNGEHRITGMNPKASFGNRFRSKLRGIIPSAALAELEFHNKMISNFANSW